MSVSKKRDQELFESDFSSGGREEIADLLKVLSKDIFDGNNG